MSEARGSAVVFPYLLRFNLGSLEGLGEKVDFGRRRHRRNDLCILHYPGSGPEGRRFKSFRPTSFTYVHDRSKKANQLNGWQRPFYGALASVVQPS